MGKLVKEKIYKDQTKFRVFWHELSSDVQIKLSTMNNNEMYECSDCGTTMILAAIGSKKTRPYFRAKNRHLESCDWKTKQGSKNRITDYRNYNVQESLDKTFSKLVSDFDVKTNIPKTVRGKSLTVSNNPAGESTTQISGKTIRARKIPNSIEDIEIGFKYLYKGNASINRFVSAHNNEYIYINIKGILFRIKSNVKYFDMFSEIIGESTGFVEIKLAMVLLVEDIASFLTHEGKYVGIWADYQVRIHAKKLKK